MYLFFRSKEFKIQIIEYIATFYHWGDMIKIYSLFLQL